MYFLSFSILVFISTLVQTQAQMLDPYTAFYGGGMGMYGGYNPYLYGAGGLGGLGGNPLMSMYAGAVNPMMMMDYGTAGMGGPMGGLLGGFGGLSGSMAGLGNSFGLMNPSSQFMAGNGMMNSNPVLGLNSNTNNIGSAGSSFGRQFRNRYTSGGVVTRENDGPNKSSGCGFIMKRACNEVT